MKRSALVLMFLALIYSASATPETSIKVEEVSPDRILPGNTFQVEVAVENSGTSPQEYRAMEVESIRGLEYMGTTSNLDERFYLCGGCQTTGTVYVKVLQNVSSGRYPLDFKVQTVNGPGIVEKTSVEVEGSADPTARASGRIEQGKTGKINVTVSNQGQDDLVDLKASPETDLVTFNPAIITMESLRPGESRTVQVEASVNEEAQDGPISVPLQISYLEDGESFSKRPSVNFQILKNVELAVSEAYAEFEDGNRVFVEVENVGEAEAESINADLDCRNAEVVAGEGLAGSLDPDESVPFSFDFKGGKKQIECSFEASFRGEDKRKMSRDLVFHRSSREIPLKPMTIGVLGLLIAGYLYGRE